MTNLFQTLFLEDENEQNEKKMIRREKRVKAEHQVAVVNLEEQIAEQEDKVENAKTGWAKGNDYTLNNIIQAQGKLNDLNHTYKLLVKTGEEFFTETK